MNRWIIFCLFFLLLLSRPCWAARVMAQIMVQPDKAMDVLFYENEKEVARWHYDPKGNITERSGTVPDGVVETYAGGLMVSRARFKNGQLNGASRDYYVNGNLRTTAQYKDGQLNGKLVVYYDGGERHYVTHYRDGIPYGVMKVYWPSGKLKTRGRFEEGEIVFVERFDQSGKLVQKNILPQGQTLSPLETP